MKDAKRLYAEHQAEFQEAIRQKVCTVCEDFGEDNRCHTHDPSGCAINSHLPELIMIALDIHSKDLSSYQEAVRQKICSTCPNPDASEKCLVRAELDCALDRYLPMVLDAVEEVIRKHA